MTLPIKGQNWRPKNGFRTFFKSTIGDLRHRQVKRAGDLAGSVAILAISSPILLLAATGIRCTMGPPVIFKQERAGRDGTAFNIVKLRTMRSARDVGTADDASRITPLGRLLRSTSIDELPSLINVAKGEMSLVGPRPLPLDYLDIYESRHLERFHVRPGLTGLAQVSGRNKLPWRRRLDLDIYYVRNSSPQLDVKILLRTLLVVLKRTGITEHGHASSSPLTIGYDRREGPEARCKK